MLFLRLLIPFDSVAAPSQVEMIEGLLDPRCQKKERRKVSSISFRTTLMDQSNRCSVLECRVILALHFHGQLGLEQVLRDVKHA